MKNIKITLYLFVFKIFNKFMFYVAYLFYKSKFITSLLENQGFFLRKMSSLSSFIDKESVTNSIEYITTDSDLYFSKPRFSSTNKEALISYKKNKNYIAHLSNCVIINGSNLLLPTDFNFVLNPYYEFLPNDYFFMDKGKRYQKNNLILVKGEKLKKTIQTGIYLSGNHSANYYHLIFEFLTKFYVVNNSSLEKDIPLLLDEVCAKIPQYKELINYFNIYDRDIIYLKSGHTYNVKELKYPSFINIFPTIKRSMIETKAEDILFNLKSIDFLKDNIKKEDFILEDKYDKVFLVRGSNKNRGYNEEEILEIVKKHNFAIVQCEKYSVSQQAAIFSKARIIIGATGAAFSNIVFCKPKTKILCFMSYKIELSIFSTIAKYLNIDFEYMVGDSPYVEGKSKVQDTFKINIQSFEKVLDVILKGKK